MISPPATYLGKGQESFRLQLRGKFSVPLVITVAVYEPFSRMVTPSSSCVRQHWVGFRQCSYFSPRFVWATLKTTNREVCQAGHCEFSMSALYYKRELGDRLRNLDPERERERGREMFFDRMVSQFGYCKFYIYLADYDEAHTYLLQFFMA